MTIFVLMEQSDVFVDACAADHHAQLLFVSAYGRDTSIQQLLARLHQSSSQGGVDQLTLLTHFGAKPTLQVMVGDPRRLEKVTGRMPKTGLLGNLVHAWIFDPVLLQIDHASRSAWLFGRALPEKLNASGSTEGGDPQMAAAWRLVKELSPVPLLDEWSSRVLAHVQAAGGFVRPALVGPISAVRIELGEDFPTWVSERVADRSLLVPAATVTATVPLKPVVHSDDELA